MRDCNMCPEPGFDPTEQTGPVYLGGVLGIDVNGVRQPIDAEGIVQLPADAAAAAESAEEAAASATAAEMSRGQAAQSATDAAGSATQAAGSATAAAASAAAAQTAAERDVPAAAASWLEAHVDPSTGYVLDNSLSVENAAADAKAAGEAVSRSRWAAETVTVIDPTSTFNFVQGTVSVSTGASSSASTTRIRTLHSVNNLARLTCDTAHGMWVYAYSDRAANTASYLGRISADGTLQKGGEPYDTQNVWLGAVPKDGYIRIVVYRLDDGTISPTDTDYTITGWRNTDRDLTIFGMPADGKATGDAINEGKSWGQSNAMASARQMLDIKWTPTAATMPSRYGYFAQTEQTGLPYSSVRDSDKAICLNVSLRTFMTAVHDPRSVLYTRRSNSSNASTYYGTVCSGVMNHAYGLDLNLTNYWLGESDLFETIPMQEIRPGDMLYIEGHVAMVGAAPRDKWGRVTSVTVWEEWPPNGRDVVYASWAEFLAAREGYIARRFKTLDAVGYTPSPYVQEFDEEPVEVTYPDVQTDHGDGAVFVAGETVHVNVSNPGRYTYISVTNGSDHAMGVRNIRDFDVPNVRPGLYTITATAVVGDPSVSEFFVADVHGSFDAETGEVTFSSSNATPVLVNAYGWPVADNAVRCYPLPLTDADRERGSVNIKDLLTMENPQAKVTFATPYGTADWRSEYHQTWEPIE